MDIFRIERYLNSIDDIAIEKRFNIFTNETKYVGIISLFDGVTYAEVGAVDLQSKDIHSAMNEWRLRHQEVLLKLAPTIASIRKKQQKGEEDREKQKEKEHRQLVKKLKNKQSWFKRLFVK